MKSTLLLALAGLTNIISASPLKPRGSGGKRGLAFPKQNAGTAGSQYTQYFAGHNQITWMYDWEAVIDGQALPLEFVPLLHSNQQWCTEGWFNNVAASQQKYKVSHVLSFNEPDQFGGGGTGMSVSDAITAHKQFVQPLAAQGLRIGSPSVTNGNEANKGINWLTQFMSGCSDCQIDFVVAHYYAWANADDFKNYLIKFHTTFNKPVWVTEFGVTEGDAAAFLGEVLPWLDAQDWIERYSYFMAAPAVGDKAYLIDPAGSGLSATGQVYATA